MESKLSGRKLDIGIVPARMFALDARQLPTRGFAFEQVSDWPQSCLHSVPEPTQIAAILPH